MRPPEVRCEQLLVSSTVSDKPEALHPHDWCKSRSVSCLNCASRFLAAMPLSKSVNYYLAGHLLTELTERILRGPFTYRYENIYPSKHLGACGGYDGVFIDPVRDPNGRVWSWKLTATCQIFRLHAAEHVTDSILRRPSFGAQAQPVSSCISTRPINGLMRASASKRHRS